MPADDSIIRVGVTADISDLQSKMAGAASTVQSNVGAIVAEFKRAGMSADEAAQAMASLGFKSAETAEVIKTAFGGAVPPIENVSKATRSLNLDFAATQIAARDLGISIPFGAARAIASIGGIGSALSLAFAPLLLIDLGETLGKSFEKLRDKAEENREAFIKVSDTYSDTSSSIQNQIDQQEQKFIELKDGPVAALEFEFSHMRSVALEVFRDIDREIGETSKAMKGTESTIFGFDLEVFGSASKEVKKFGADLDEAMRAAQKAAPKDVFAPFEAGLKTVDSQIQTVQDRIKLIQEPPGTPGRQNIMVSTDTLDKLQKELELLQAVRGQLSQGVELQKAKNVADQEALAKAGENRADEVAKNEGEAFDLVQRYAKQDLEAVNKFEMERRELARQTYEAMNAIEQQNTESQKESLRASAEAVRANIADQEEAISAGVEAGDVAKAQAHEVAQAKLEAIREARTEGLISATEEEQAADQVLDTEERTTAIALQQKVDAYAQLAALDARYLPQLEKSQAELAANSEKFDLQREKYHEQMLRQEFNAEQSVLAGIDREINTNLTKWITGQERWRKASYEMWNAVGDNAIRNLLKMAEQEIEGLVVKKAVAQESILVDAKKAAGGAYSAVSDVPMIGPALAPIAAAAAFAAVLAFGSFQSGGIVPADMVAQVHEGEGVFTPTETRNIQAIAQGGGGDIHVHAAPMSAVDTAGMAKLMKRQMRQLEGIARQAARQKGKINRGSVR